MDARISREILRVLEPAAVEASVLAIEKLNEQADAVLTVLQSDLQAAQYQASRAQKQFDAADPENRLVADELERRWNEALQRLHDAEQRLAEHQGTTPHQTDISSKCSRT